MEPRLAADSAAAAKSAAVARLAAAAAESASAAEMAAAVVESATAASAWRPGTGDLVPVVDLEDFFTSMEW